jgi:hypothetical protein
VKDVLSTSERGEERCLFQSRNNGTIYIFGSVREKMRERVKRRILLLVVQREECHVVVVPKREKVGAEN